MSTRSSIALLNEDGSVSQIYCHFDGYPEGVGLTLRQFYDTRDKVEALINLGNISSLKPSIEKPPGHTFETPVDGYTVAYHRDRNEEGQEAKLFKTINDYYKFLESPQDHFYDYAYVFIGSGWKAFHLKIEDLGRNIGRRLPVSPTLKTTIMNKDKTDELENIAERIHDTALDEYWNSITGSLELDVSDAQERDYIIDRCLELLANST
jgi:hypothetical protein